MFGRVRKAACLGALSGLLLGVLAGGGFNALFGQPFSGLTGFEVFPDGLWFPGLVIFAPFTASIGAVLGAGVACFRRFLEKRG
jgi:hypothetical protein